MRTSLVIFGVIFLVIGGLLYYVPLQQLSAGTTTTGDGSTDVRTSSASFIIPVEWAYASAVIGFVLLILGLVIPGPAKGVPGPRGPRGRGPAHHRRSTSRRSRRRGAALPRGTSVTTTTRIKR